MDGGATFSSLAGLGEHFSYSDDREWTSKMGTMLFEIIFHSKLPRKMIQQILLGLESISIFFYFDGQDEP